MTPDHPVREDYDCLPLPAFDAGDFHAVRAAFRGAMPIPLTQAWLDQQEPDFAPGTVRTGWRDDSLFVFAEFVDHDIFTRAREHNMRFWELGDTFEIFLQPAPAAAYVELHVAPSNMRLQLRFAAPPAPESGVDSFEPALIREDVFRSQAWVSALARQWCVLAEVPAAAVRWIPGPSGQWSPGASAPGSSLAGANWRVSFCRYDYTRGRARPVILVLVPSHRAAVPSPARMERAPVQDQLISGRPTIP